MQGIDVSVICDGRTSRVGVTGAAGFKIDCRAAPTQVLLGLRMYGVASQTIDVSGQAGTDKAYVFEFDTGDLGTQAVCLASASRWKRQRQFPGHDLRRYADPGARRAARSATSRQ